MTLAAFILALIWGVVWALCLQTKRGRFLAARLTWMAVAIGIGVDLLIVLLLVPIEIWLQLVVVVALSAIGIVARSLSNDHEDQQMLHLIVNGDKDTTAQ
jgi:hypothetical protein